MNFFSMLLITVILSGCTQVKQLQNIDPLLTLKGYSDEKEDQEKWIAQEAKRFENIVAAVKDKSVEHFSTQESFRQQFGEPVLIEHIPDGTASIERWLYRHPIQKLATDRVYIFFDSNGRFLRYEHIVPPVNG
jgi:hypothetical protein